MSSIRSLCLPVVIAMGAFGAGGCHPTASLEVLRPADVPVPSYVQTLAVIDRSRASNAGQEVLGTIEGLLTGESILGDKEGRREAVSATASRLAQSPRFQTRVPPYNKDAFESNLFDKPMSWEAVERVCAASGADAVVALEAFDSDSSMRDSSAVETSTDSNGREVRKTVWTAERSTRVLSGWRVYDPKSKSILDDQRSFPVANSWSGTGASKSAARAQLPAQADTVRMVGGLTGTRYAERIAPSYIYVSRDYYGGSGDDRMKEGKRRARMNDWQGAGELWAQAAESAVKPKVKGKAMFNQALALEVAGDLGPALDMAKEAGVILHNGRARSYVWALERRLSDARRLEQQMAPPPPEEPPPLAVPKQPKPRAEEVVTPPAPKGGPVSAGGTRPK